MGYFRFRRSIKILPGVRWNIGKNSTSFSFGPRGLKYTIGTQGSRTTVGIPGTGLSYTHVQPHSAPITPAPTPPTLAPSPLPPKKSKLSRFFYILGVLLLLVWLFGTISKQYNWSSDTAPPSISRPPAKAHPSPEIQRALPVAPPTTPRRAKPVRPEDLARPQNSAESSPAELGEENLVEILALRSTYVSVTIGEEKKTPVFEHWISPADGVAKFRAKRVSIRVLNPDAVWIMKNGKALDKGDEDVTINAPSLTSSPEVRRAKPVRPEDLTRPQNSAESSPAKSGEQNRVAIRPLKRTYMRVTVGDEKGNPAFERWVSPADGTIEFRGKHISIRVLAPDAVQITKNGKSLGEGDKDVTVN
jgi:hypothetical protein